MRIDFSKSVRFSAALTLAVASMYTLCMATFLVLPDFSYSFYESWFHGLGLTANSVVRPMSMTLEGYLVGLICVSMFSFVGGLIFSSISQLLNQRSLFSSHGQIRRV